MKTVKNIKFTRTNKHSKYRKQHIYYIVKCFSKKDDFNPSELEYYLQKLGVVPDTKAMNIITKLDMDYIKKSKKSLDEYCTDKQKLPHINKELISADIFFLSRYNSSINTRFYKYPKYLVNSLNMDLITNISNKSIILDEMLKITLEAKKYIPSTFNINEIDKYEFPKWYILRPIFGSLGKDIFYVSNQKDLENALDFYNKKTKYGSNIIASQYISNPLLFQNKKFHLRIYYIISICNNVFNTFLLDYAKIITAKEPFDMKEPFSKDKHNSHGKTTITDFFYPTEFNNENINKVITDSGRDKLWVDISKMFSILAAVFENYKDKLLYENEKNGYHFFGIDVMITENMEPKFIEINKAPLTACIHQENCDKLGKIIYKWINEIILEPLIKYNNPYIARKHKTYIKPFK